MPQQVELLAAQVHGLAVDGGYPAAGVHGEATGTDRLVGIVLSHPAENGPDAGVELVGGVRLDHVVIGTGVEGADDLPLLVTGGGHDDRDGAYRTQYAGRLQASPHKYAPAGRYLTLVPSDAADTDFRLIFETDGSNVTRFRAGTAPEVSFVEGCS